MMPCTLLSYVDIKNQKIRNIQNLKQEYILFVKIFWKVKYVFQGNETRWLRIFKLFYQIRIFYEVGLVPIGDLATKKAKLKFVSLNFVNN